jgi:NAD(P)H-hydrate repair Nnr-like enzyme with NAD(P)H-hydrate dehydratase domain
VVLTPHAGELAALLTALGSRVTRDEVAGDPVAAARQVHNLTGATVLLKGSTTFVVGPGGVYAQAEAPHWLATAGAGDVLAGLLGTMLAARSAEVVAQPTLATEIAAAAALVHGRAAARVNPSGPITASGVAAALPATIAAILQR